MYSRVKKLPKVCGGSYTSPSATGCASLLYTSNIVNTASQQGLMIHLYADDTHLT